MSSFIVQSNFAGSPFTLSATCPSGATTRTLYLPQETAEKVAALLTETLAGERWSANPAQ